MFGLIFSKILVKEGLKMFNILFKRRNNLCSISSIILGILLIVLSLFLAPIWWDDCPWKDFGINSVNYLTGGMLLLFVIFYLIPKLLNKKTSKIYKGFLVAEIILQTLSALSSILVEFNFLPIEGASQILGFAFWTRGVVVVSVLVLENIFYNVREKADKECVFLLFASIFLITTGCYYFFKNPVTNETILYAFITILAILGLFSIAIGILCIVMLKKAKKRNEEKRLLTAEPLNNANNNEEINNDNSNDENKVEEKEEEVC